MKKRFSFRYDHRCVRRNGFVEVVNNSWRSNANGQAGLMSKIAVCRKTISNWKRQAKPNSAVRIQELHYKIDEASRQENYRLEEFQKLKKELDEEYYNEELFWMEQSRLIWLRSGDKNTKFFHAVTKNRRAQSRIKSLIDEEGNEWFSEEDLGRVAENYFKKLFASESVGFELEEWSEIPTMLSPSQNDALMAPITKEEVRKAVFEINPTKCPGQDGMNGFFFQQFWETNGDDITATIQRFFESGDLEGG